MAEGEGFEPPRPCGPPVFKTGAINHSAIPPSLHSKAMHILYHNISETGLSHPIPRPQLLWYN